MRRLFSRQRHADHEPAPEKIDEKDKRELTDFERELSVASKYLSNVFLDDAIKHDI